MTLGSNHSKVCLHHTLLHHSTLQKATVKASSAVLTWGGSQGPGVCLELCRDPGSSYSFTTERRFSKQTPKKHRSRYEEGHKYKEYKMSWCRWTSRKAEIWLKMLCFFCDTAWVGPCPLHLVAQLLTELCWECMSMGWKGAPSSLSTAAETQTGQDRGVITCKALSFFR